MAKHKSSTNRSGKGSRSAKGSASRSSKRPVTQYEHTDHQRPNNPPVGLVTPETDPPPPPEKARKAYRYDPHLDPALNFDPSKVRDELAAVIESGLADEPPTDPEDRSAPGATLAEGRLAKVEAQLARTKAALQRSRDALRSLKRAQEPYLNWAGKAERTSFEVPTVSLHVHERIDPKTIIEAVRARNGNGHDEQMALFEQPALNPPLRDAVEFYKHPHGWTNRLVAGDSLLVMNSLLEKEGLAGKVQMVYIDPPYGIRYGSNFQPFVNRRDVKDGKDEDLTREPEMLKAFRDTWELGIHSYLAYLRDRLILARELLHESGSCFVQISDENLHHVRELMEEVFGAANFVSLVTFFKSGSQTSTLLPPMCDYLVWYARDKSKVKHRPVWYLKTEGRSAQQVYRYVTLPGGESRPMTPAEREGQTPLPEGARVFRLAGMTSQSGSDTTTFVYNLDGREFRVPRGGWRTTREGMDRLRWCDRITPSGSTIGFRKYLDDFPFSPHGNLWIDTGTGSFTDPKVYVVQTGAKVIHRCMLMTTDPGDLVLDPTCGSGTTAVVAEQWGRRWITTDTSRVAIALAKQRLTTAVFDYYELDKPDLGVSGGFRYKTVPHVTLRSIANNPEIREGMTREQIDAAIARYAPQETLYDQPMLDRSKARVTGPFTVEAVPAPVVTPISDVETTPAPGSSPAWGADESISREGETLRQSEWREELLRTGARGEGGMKMEFVRVEPLPGATWLHAEGEIRGDGEFRGKAWKRGDRVVIAFGPEHAPMEQRQVEAAWREAASLSPKPGHVVFAAFQFDPEAAKDIEEANPRLLGMTFFRAEMNDDLHTEDLKKKRSSNESFWLIGQPDVVVEQLGKDAGEDAGRFVVEVQGFDYFNMKEGVIDSGGPEKIAMWMLDTDYDGRSLYPRQVFFPMAGEKDGWTRLAKTLRAEIDEEKIEAYRGTRSLPFEPGKHGQIAVKVVDDRGFESLVSRELTKGRTV